MRFQLRHGFYLAYLLVTAAYVVVLRIVPTATRSALTVALVFSDASVLGFFFVGGSVLLERDQRVLESLFVTPLHITEYVLAKIASLALLSLAVSVAIVLIGYGVPRHPLIFVLGTLLGSVVAVLIGLLISTRARHLNGYFGLSFVYVPFFVLPVLHVSGLWTTPIVYLMPPYAALVLIAHGFFGGQWWQVLYGVLVQAVGIVVLFRMTNVWFRRYVVTRVGDA